MTKEEQNNTHNKKDFPKKKKIFHKKKDLTKCPSVSVKQNDRHMCFINTL